MKNLEILPIIMEEKQMSDLRFKAELSRIMARLEMTGDKELNKLYMKLALSNLEKLERDSRIIQEILGTENLLEYQKLLQIIESGKKGIQAMIEEMA